MFLPRHKLRQVDWFEKHPFDVGGHSDTVILHYRQWWKPRKNIRFATIPKSDEDGKLWAYHGHDYIQLVTQLHVYVTQGTDQAMDLARNWAYHKNEKQTEPPPSTRIKENSDVRVIK